ncbi:hypothetical protein PTTG_29361 [Puccinia triticina 1-1 BBBD Race 1]|uniref:Uncharacterized protein n=2 Tax=Puccinia triticina TaxID=208348 RepID=A0A180G4L7_PUCT1|nr:uncharacterized protein PtA15_8A467 [Puccinia triticina]OAV87607.1 hypothetical protein PTTG_29361 [Puccinia triticina 1-1 BBBD Race 1]WAQ87563.1 hypothetical protein PtA15_8A467 [Puccinia triticina]WAR57412.1 hypothetical protein PtB15_8B459 [Puccinia triticina]
MKLIFFLVPLVGSLIASPVTPLRVARPQFPDETFEQITDNWVPYHDVREDGMPYIPLNWQLLQDGPFAVGYPQQTLAENEKSAIHDLASLPEPDKEVPSHDGRAAENSEVNETCNNEQFRKEYSAAHADPITS